MVPLFFKQLLEKLNLGFWPYAIILGHTTLGTALVYTTPRSNLAFLTLITSFFSLYWFRADTRFKIVTGVLLALVVIPIVGVRNIFYLEVIFQICVCCPGPWFEYRGRFCRPARPGLCRFLRCRGLSLGLLRFTAVLCAALRPGTQPSNLPFLLPGDAFYLFLFLAIIVAAFTGILLGLPVLRLRGDYLAIVTLGFGEVIRVLANNLDKPLNFTNGPQGITPIQRPTMPIGRGRWIQCGSAD
jgi:branched-chain amino acid transport system permease protein